ncbi:hypothetical protein MNB_SM-7-1417 [hydrothermal vent metagenome]|uniref:Uncharacterized protein n=1 Tax=hydrothermal vent metagenome TaxID=652676 RepID=A0A1W1BW96_9ZZZZ
MRILLTLLAVGMVAVSAEAEIVEDANDLCYEDVVSSGMMCFDMGTCSGGMGCKNTYPLRNVGDDELENVVVIYKEDGLGGSFGNSCGVEPSGSCQTVHNVDMGPAGIFGQTTEFDLDNPIPVNNNDSSVWTKNFISGVCFDSENLYATYVKNGVTHRGKIHSCDDMPPPPPEDETVPDDEVNATESTCGVFEDMFQTREACSGGSGGFIDIENAGQTLDGSNNIILHNLDNQVATCSFEAANWVEDQYETCGEHGDCLATGTNAASLDIDYNNPPAIADLDKKVTSSSTDVKIEGDTTLDGYEYDEIKPKNNGIVDYTVDFEITNSLKINTISTTKGNTYNFSSGSLYELQIGEFKVKSNGSGTTVTTDNNAKNIKIYRFEQKADATVDLEAKQTIKMDKFYVGRGSTVTLKAPYININHFEPTNDGKGDTVIDIYADYIDMDYIELSQDATVRIHPYTAGKRILFRNNNLTESSSSTILLSTGKYYVNDDWVLPSTSDVSAIRAIDKDQDIDFILNHGLEVGNNPGINAMGNNGNFGDLEPSKFRLFINGSLKTGGGGTTLNATIYVEDNVKFGNPTYVKGAINANHKMEIGQGQFLYDQNLSENGWGSCGGGGSLIYVTGPFDAWDTFRDDDSTPPSDRNISTKIVNQPFKLSLASLNKDNDAYETKPGVGSSIDVAIYKNGTTEQVSTNSITFDANSTAHISESDSLTVAKAVSDAVVGFKLCATYQLDPVSGEKEYYLHPQEDCSYSSQLHECNATTSGVPTWHICYASDNFAVRPYAFVAFGKNQYKRAGEAFDIIIKAVDENEYDKVGNSDHSGEKSDSVNSVSAFDESLDTINIVSNFYQPTSDEIDQMKDDTGKDDVATCPEAGVFTFENSSDSFTDGEVNATLKFSETGILDINISEKSGSEWAKVDEDDTPDDQRYIKFSSVTYDENNISASTLQLYIPYEFNTTAEYNTTANNGSWLYMCDINKSNSTFKTPSMATFVKYTITAYNKDGDVVKNFTKTCFPDTHSTAPKVNGLKLNTTFDLFLDLDLNSSADVNISLYTEDNTSNAIWTPNKNLTLQTGKNHVQEWISPFQFENGVGEAKVYFNIDRNISKALNPVEVIVDDANTSTSWMDSSGSPKAFNGTILNESKAFIYGKTYVPREKIIGNEGNVSLYYVAYCSGADCNLSLLPDGTDSKIVDDPRWYINTQHTAVFGLPGVVQQKHANKIEVLRQPTGNHQDYVELKYKNNHFPYKTTMENNASEWLIYNKYDENATHNEFDVKFESSGGEWAGKNESNSSTKTSNVNKSRILQW